MIIEQTVIIPDDYRIFLELPHSVPSGVIAQVKIDIPAVSAKDKSVSSKSLSKIDEVRQLLQKEMAEKGTSATAAASGDGWTAYVSERHGKKSKNCLSNYIHLMTM